MAMEPLPLFVGDAVPFSSFWSFQQDELRHQPQESVAELKQRLVATTLELEAAKEELGKKERSAAKLADVVRQVARERDEARDQLRHLLLLAAPAPRVASSVTDSDGSLASSPVVDPVTSADERRCKPSPTATPPTPPPPPPAAAMEQQQQQQPLAGSAADAVLDMLASKRPLPRRGRLLAAVMEAGPLLQNLLVAGQLPRWRNPPTVHAPDALALGARATTVGYGDGANGSMDRPVPMPPLAPMAAAAANCSRGFVAKRVRLH